jgi:hypothetical protein
MADALLPSLTGSEGPSSNLATMEELFTRFICTESRLWTEQLFAIVVFGNSFLATMEEIAAETMEETGIKMETTVHLTTVILLGRYP